MRNNVDMGDEAVVFQATMEDHVTIERGATVAGAVTIREDAIVPTQAEAGALPLSYATGSSSRHERARRLVASDTEFG